MTEIGKCAVEFDAAASERVVKLQTAYLQQLNKTGNLNVDKLKIDSCKENTVGVSVYMDLTRGNCGYSPVMASEIVGIFTTLSSLMRPQFNWWSAYKGSSLPYTPLYKKPWEEK